MTSLKAASRCPVRLMCAAIVLASLAVFAAAEETTSDLRDHPRLPTLKAQFATWFPDTMMQQGVPGLAVALVDREGAIWMDAFGVTDRKSARKVDEDTLFSIQSMSKTVTTTAVLVAVQKGLLDLDAPITEYQPDFTVNSRYEKNPEKKMTLRLLLSHRAGFTHEAPVGNNYDLGCSELEPHAASITQTWLRYPVGQRFAYSNLGIDLAGLILQKVSGMPFEDFVEKELLRPIGMQTATYDWKKIRAAENRAIGHDPEHDEVPLEHALIPCGSCHGSIKDLAAFVRFHLDEGRVDGKPFLKPEILAAMTDATRPVESSVFCCTLGVFKGNWFYEFPYKHDYFQHSGGGLGFRSVMKWFPEYGFGVVVLANSAQANTEYMADMFINTFMRPLIDSDPLITRVRGAEIADVPEDAFDSFAGRYGPEGKALEVTVDEGIVILSFGEDEEYILRPTAPNEGFFQREGQGFPTMLRFMPPEKGCARYILNLNRGETFDFHDGPDDPKGPDKEEWKQYVGEYEWIQWGKVIASGSFSIRNGHPYVRDERLTEHLPGLFFTCNGEALDLRQDPPTFMNVAVRKKDG